MRRWRWFAVFCLLALFSAPALSRLPRNYRSETRAVAIDGMRFVAAIPAGDDDRSASAPFLAEPLRESGGDALAPPPVLPPGLCAERTLRMETGSGPVTVAMGRIESAPQAFRESLQRAGWSVPARATAAAAESLASITTGKETRVVVMDEKERRFLFLLRLEE